MQTSMRWMIGALALGLGCGGAQVEPPGDDSASQGAESTTGPGATTGATEAASATEVSPTTDDTAGATDTGADACEGPGGCFDCAPKQPLEFLNACTDATCAPFENTKKRLPLLNDDGTRPPLP